MNESWEHLLPKWLHRIGMILRDLACLFLFGIMMSTVVDVGSRTLGLGGVPWLIEVTGLSVILIVFFGLAATTAAGGHIIIDLFTQKNEPETNRVIDAFWLVISALVLGVIGWYSFWDAWILYGYGERTEILRLPILTVVWPSVVCMVLTSVIALIIAARVLPARGRTGPGPHDDSPVTKDPS